MQQYRFCLEPYKGSQSRHVCPQCNEPGVFVRYIDEATGRHLDAHVGRCNRQLKCNYHYPPRKYFEEQRKKGITRPHSHATPPVEQKFGDAVVSKVQPGGSEAPYIPFDTFKSSLHNYDKNSFAKYLLRLFEKETTEKLIAQYCIGTSSYFWKEDVIFWYIDIEGIPRAGQIKHFDSNGHTAKYMDPTGTLRSCTTWAHTFIKIMLDKMREPYPDWFAAYLKSKVKVSCLFGEHLLNQPENRYKPVAVVEAPKTATIASVYLPQYVWVATGSLANLTVERCKALEGRQVVLYPDAGAFELWKQKAEALSCLAQVRVSELIEQKATAEQRKEGWDLADYLVQFPVSDFRSKPLNIQASTISSLLGTCNTGAEFERLVIQGLASCDGKVFDLLVDANGELINPGEKQETVKRLATFFEKQFVEATLDGMPCLAHIDPRFP